MIKKDIIEKTGLSPRLVQFYTDEKAIKPISGGGKRGQAWEYTEQNLVEFGIVKRLADCGITVKQIRKIMNRLEGYILLWRHFSNGSRVKPLSAGQYVFLVIYDWETPEVFYRWDKAFKGFSMSGHENALVLNITREMRW